MQSDRLGFILVTGGAGYIGSYFIYRLLESIDPMPGFWYWMT
jgi:nucleoside-diphosphate-sugar epimerase